MERVILIPKEMLPEAYTLDSEILGAYREKIKHYGRIAFDSLNIFKDKKGDLSESNCFAPLKLREVLPEGVRLATMADLGRATKINPDFLKGFESDTGLVLRTAGDSHEENNLLAKDLAKQLKKREITLASPKIIYFDALDLKSDLNSDYGLAYELNEKAEFGVNIIDAPELINSTRFKTINEKGIPIKDDNGNRILYTRQDGLSWFCLDGNSCVSSNFWLLNASSSNSRVVVVGGDDILQKIKQKKKE